MGIQQILQHATGLKHGSLSHARFGMAQAHFVAIPAAAVASKANSDATDPSVMSPHGSSCVPAKSHSLVLSKAHQDQVTAAEIKWVLKSVECDMSFRCCEGISDLFQQMFPGPVSQDFTCSATKASYIVRFGLGPHFKNGLMKDIIQSNNGYTMHFDETTTAQIKKQLDLVVRYWSNERNGIVVRYFHSLFFGHADAKTVVTSMLTHFWKVCSVWTVISGQSPRPKHCSVYCLQSCHKWHKRQLSPSYINHPWYLCHRLTVQCTYVFVSDAFAEIVLLKCHWQPVMNVWHWRNINYTFL